MHYADRHLLLTPERLALESGVERLDDGVHHVAAKTPMLGVRLWMGIVETDLLGGWVQRLANTPFVRGRQVTHAAAQALECHCHEEMSTLASFLPELWAREAAR